MIMDVINQEQLNNSNITVTGKGSVATLKNVLADKRLTYLQGNGYTEQDGTPTPDAPIHIGGLADKGYFDGALTQGYRGASDGVYAWDNRHITNSNGIECKSGDIIKIKYEEIPERLNLVFYDKDNVYVSGSYKDNVNEHEVTAPENAKCVYFTVKQENITPSKAKHISVTINGQYAVRVKTGNRNLFAFGKTAIDKTSELRPQSNQRLTLSKVDKNTIKCNYNGGNYSVGYIVIEGIDGTKDYKISYTISDNTTNYKPTMAKDSLSNENQLVLLVNGGNTSNIVSSNNYFVLSNIQVEYGTVATPYEPHQETTALIPASSPLYDGDYIEVYADGSGQIVRETRKLDGTGNWWADDYVGEGYRYSFAIAHKGLNSPLYSTHYKQLDASSYNAVGDYIENRETTTKISVRTTNTELSNATNFKAWLLENDVYILIKLATPTETPLTAEQVAEFKKLYTFDNVTHATSDGVARLVLTGYQNNDEGKAVNSLMNGVSNLENTINERIDSLTDNTNTINENLSNLEDEVTNKIKIDLVQYNESVTINANSYITVNLPFSSTPYKHTILGILQVATYNSDIIGEVGYIGDEYIQVKLHNLTSTNVTLTNGVNVKFSAWKRNV